MIKGNVNKLVGLKKEDFDQFVKFGQIQLQPARLIPVLRTGDEMALTSIFLSGLKLIKEFRSIFFKEIDLTLRGRFYFYTEAKFTDIDKSKIDGLIIVVSSGKIVDAAFLEMKNGNNNLHKEQLEKYFLISKKLKVDKFVTVSNEFVTNSNHSPVSIKTPKSVVLFHFSWTYLMTKAQLLLFNNKMNINDKDQVEIMREILFYFQNEKSGIKGYTKMKPDWKKLSEDIKCQRPLTTKDKYIEEAVLSWYELEKSLSLFLTRKLGVIVEPVWNPKDRLKSDLKTVVNENYMTGLLSVPEAVSKIKIKAEFERRTISISLSVTPPQNKRNSARITWVNNQLKKCNRKAEGLFCKYADDIWLEADINYKQENLRIRLKEITSFSESVGELNDIKKINIILIKCLGSNFSNRKRVISIMESLILDFYKGFLMHFTTWKKTTPKKIKSKVKPELPKMLNSSIDQTDKKSTVVNPTLNTTRFKPLFDYSNIDTKT